MIRAFRSLAPVVGLMLVGLAAADIYKWVDEAGEVHYSDQPPPPNAKVKEHVKGPAPEEPGAAATPAQPGSDPTPTAAPNSVAEQEMEFRKRQAEQEKAEAEQRAQLAEAETKRRNCEQARNRLVGLQAGARVSKYRPNGEIIYLNAEEIAGAIVEAQAVANSWCN